MTKLSRLNPVGMFPIIPASTPKFGYYGLERTIVKTLANDTVLSPLLIDTRYTQRANDVLNSTGLKNQDASRVCSLILLKNTVVLRSFLSPFA